MMILLQHTAPDIHKQQLGLLKISKLCLLHVNYNLFTQLIQLLLVSTNNKILYKNTGIIYKLAFFSYK